MPANPLLAFVLASTRHLLSRFVAALGCAFALQGGAQTTAPATAPAEAPMKEVSVAASAFVRGAPLPPWADLLPLPPPAAPRRALAVRLDETQLWVADTPVQLVNLAQQANDPAALGQLGQVAMHFIPQYQRLLLHKVLILRGEQVIDHTASANVRFLQRESGLEQGIYSGVITASLLLPDVRVGDTLHLQYSIEGANPIFGGHYLQGALWQRPVAVQWRRVTISHPADRRIQWKWLGDGPGAAVSPEVSAANGIQRLRFDERELRGVELEPMTPRDAYALRWLQFSEFADWADVARWADGLFPSDAPLPAELTPLIQRWQRLPARAEQVSQALQWVQGEIRYYSVSLGESSHRPHTPTEVLRNRYGDCKDKSLLLMRILQTLGIPARAVLASLAAPRGPAKQLASPLAFDHAVVQARVDGREFYLDPTRLGQRGPPDRIGQGLEDASVLVVDGRETNALSVVRSPNRDELFRTELSERFKLDAFGDDGELETQQQWFGLGAETIRLTLARLDAARLQRAVLTGLERRYPGITLVGTPELSDEVDRNRITLRARFKVPKLANAVDGAWVLRFAPTNLQGAIAVPPSPTRTFALALPSYPVTVAYNAEVQWPSGVSALVEPVTQRIDNAQFKAEVTRSFRGSVARVALRFEPLVPSVPAAAVPTLLDDVKKIDRAIGGTISVARNQVGNGGAFGIGRKPLPERLRERAQAAVDRSGKSIASGQLAGDDLALALCLRAQAQAELGRFAEATKDAADAVQLAPALGAAWFCRANVDWSRGDFSAASAGFGQALLLGHSAADAYYRRGQARFYEGKLEIAADDFGKSAAERKGGGEKAYALLWQAWTLQRLGKPLPADIGAAADATGAWPRPALALFTGQASPEQVLEQIARKEGDERDLALAEGWFYIGEYQLNRSQPGLAREAFDKARAQGIASYLEHVAAGFELQRLGGKP